MSKRRNRYQSNPKLSIRANERGGLQAGDYDPQTIEIMLNQARGDLDLYNQYEHTSVHSAPAEREWIKELEEYLRRNPKTRSVSTAPSFEPQQNWQNSPTSKASNFLNLEKQRVNSFPYQEYTGQRVANKSPLTQQSEQLQDKYSQKMPYQKQMNELVGRQNNIEGLSTDDRKQLDDYLNVHRQKMETKALGFLDRNFRQPHNQFNHPDKFADYNTKQVNRQIPLTQEEFNNFSQVLAQDQRMTNTQKTDLLRRLGTMQSEDRNKLIGALSTGGNQQTAIANMGLEANKKNFHNQAAQPYRDMELLEKELKPHQDYQKMQQEDDIRRYQHANNRKLQLENSGSDIGEYLSPMNNELPPSTGLHQILATYGVHNQDDNEQNWRRQGVQAFPSREVAQTPQELTQAQNGLMNLNIKKSPELKDAVRAMVGDRNEVTNKIVNPALSNNMAKMDYDEKMARKEMKNRAEHIGNRFSVRGQYGSAAHQRAIEEDMAAFNAHRYGERGKSVLSSLNNQTQLNQHDNKLNMQHAQYMALLNQMNNEKKLQKELTGHSRGVQQFNTEQDVLDNQYIDKVARHDYQWPGLKSHVLGQGFDISGLNKNNYKST